MTEYLTVTRILDGEPEIDAFTQSLKVYAEHT
jgi:hypothetical protein